MLNQGPKADRERVGELKWQKYHKLYIVLLILMKCALEASRVLQQTFSFPHTNQQQQQVKPQKWINYYKQHTG